MTMPHVSLLGLVALTASASYPAVIRSIDSDEPPLADVARHRANCDGGWFDDACLARLGAGCEMGVLEDCAALSVRLSRQVHPTPEVAASLATLCRTTGALCLDAWQLAEERTAGSEDNWGLLEHACSPTLHYGCTRLGFERLYRGGPGAEEEARVAWAHGCAASPTPGGYNCYLAARTLLLSESDASRREAGRAELWAIVRSGGSARTFAASTLMALRWGPPADAPPEIRRLLTSCSRPSPGFEAACEALAAALSPP